MSEEQRAVERERSPAERAVIWLLRRWWALAVVVIGGALGNQFGGVVSALFTELLRGAPLSVGNVTTSWRATLFALNPARGAVVLGTALLITLVAFLADRAERGRLARIAARDAQERASHETASRRAETRQIAAELIQEVSRTQRPGEAGEDDDAAEPDDGLHVALPPRPALVLGREAELAAIAAAVTRPGATATLLRGMGGVGKSTLLAETLHRQAEARTFPDGVVWLACQNLTGDEGATQIYDAAASALGRTEVSRARGVTVKAAALARAVAGRRILFALDNVEADLPLPAALATLTARDAANAGPVALLTGRAAWPDLPGLTEIDLRELDPAAALALLRALLAQAGRPLLPADEADARDVVTAVGALPLAIELVAPRVARRGESLATIARRLRDDGVQLRGRARGIERTFADTFDQLPASEQTVFAALSVFDGGEFGQAAALAAADALGPATEQSLADLADLSLLRALPQGDGPPRYALHPLLRQFARERLRERGATAEATASGAAARYYRGFVAKSSRHTWVSQAADLRRDYANILGAVEWCHATFSADPAGEAGLAAAALLGDFAGSLRFFLSDYGFWTDGRRVLEWGVAADEALGNRHRQAMLLAALGFILRQQGDLDGAEQCYQRSLRLAEESGDQRAAAARVHNLGSVALARGALPLARERYTTALARRRALRDNNGTAATLRALGALAAEEGQWDEARRALREALDLLRDQRNDIAYSRTQRELAAVAIRDPLGDRGATRAALDAVLHTAQTRSLAHDQAQALDWLGALDLLEDQPAAARDHWEAALAIYTRLGATTAAAVRQRLAALQRATVPA